MPPIPLPQNPSLEHLKSQAKLVQQLIGAGDAEAVKMVREFHPRLAGEAPGSDLAGFKRSDAQLVIARLYGFSSWTQLRNHVTSVSDFARPDVADTDPSTEADEFAALGCISYGDHDALGRVNRASQMVDAAPALSWSSIAAMATAGNHQRLRQVIDRDPALVDQPCGPNGWPPLLYCTYSRVEATNQDLSTLETAKALVDHGADPNAGFLWRGLLPPFTALTGAVGRGEQDQPRHQIWPGLARLLLEAGADPNDGQALYNNGLAGTAHDDPSHLELLTEFGLGTDRSGPWYRRFGSRLTAPAKLLDDELEVAALRGLPNRMRFLIGLGLVLTRGVGRSGHTPMRLATEGGHQDVVDLLTAAGVQADS